MNISLPDAMKAFVEEQVQSGGYGTVSEYVRDLVRRDQKERAHNRLEALLLEGLESGPGEPVTPEFWEGLRREIQERRNKRKPSV
ncbi:MAG: type II toxin-antitoxin system ParD family antitoxin [Bryobacterales bacterium]|nr:type II toxin-antitoxin system ParD family antitoxin [Bryobacterales bacterium]